MPVDEIAECLHGAHHCGNAAVAVDLQRVNVAHRIVGGPAELTQKTSVIAEVNPQPFRYGKNPLEMRNLGKHFFLEPVAEQQRPFLVAGRATRPLAAGKSNKELLPAVLALDTSESFLQVSTFQKLIDGRTNHRPPVTVPLLEALRVYSLELVKAGADNLEKRRGLMVTRAVEFTGQPCLAFWRCGASAAIAADGMTRSPEGETGETNQASCRETQLCTID